MKKISRLVALALCCILLVGIVTACGGGSPSNTGSTTSASTAPLGGAGAPGNAAGASDGNSGQAAGFAEEEKPVKDTLSFIARTDLGTLYNGNMGGDLFAAIGLVNEPLWFQAKMVPDADVEMVLAESLEVISPTEWIIHLRKNVKFSNGNPFTASDVIFTLKTLKESTNGVPRTQLQQPENMEIIDDYTLRWIWDDFHIGQYGIITDILIIDEESYTEEGAATKPIGTGPYIVSEYVVNSHLFLEKRDDYWGEEPEFKYIQYRIMSEPAQIANALQTGLVDVALSVANSDIDYLNDLPNVYVVSYFDTTYANMRFNPSPQGPLHDVEARYAICHAIDRQAIVDVVFGGRAEVLKRHVSMDCVDNEPRFDNQHPIYSIGYDVELAKKYADSSGLTGKTIKLMNTGLPEYVLICEMVQDMLAQIGVDVQIVSYDAATATELGRDDITASSWDFTVSQGINPGYRVASVILMGVRSTRVLDTPGMWGEPGEIEEFVPKSYSFMNTPDPKVRSDLTYWMIDVWNKYALSYGLCDVMVSTAMSTSLDPSSFVYRHNGGLYAVKVRSAQ